ncbi:MAG: biotin-dependent carboxyltransferase family protein, partial [Ferruginibacter sp.]
MGIKIIKPGLFTTLQDLGRPGYRCDGIGPGGVMDFFAASVANFLTGNDEHAPVLEMHFPAAELLFEEDALVSITGADFGACIDDAETTLWKPLLIKKQQRLSFKKHNSGARVYLSVQGGIKADRWLNSYSTQIKVQEGGYKGRALLKGDGLDLLAGNSFFGLKNFPVVTALAMPVYKPASPIRCIGGTEWGIVEDESKAKFVGELFSITAQSDRMGYRLQAINLVLNEPVHLVSSPVDLGTIQLLPSGQLIILMADHQTTGGYPRVANVISADLPKLAQQH